MNIQGKNKIDWCDVTVNPVVGCPRGCSYCYAKKINDRFKIIPDFTKPQFFFERLKQLKSKESKSIFLNSMSDIAHWTGDWVSMVTEVIKLNPQHRYIMLTKDYNNFTRRFNLLCAPFVFIGATVTMQEQADRLSEGASFINIEPIIEPIKLKLPYRTAVKSAGFDVRPLGQIIIGAETGNRKDKVIPKKEWIAEIVKQADDYSVSVFMKENLRKIMGDNFRQDKLIWEVGT